MNDDYDATGKDDAAPRAGAHGDLLIKLKGWYQKDIVRVQEWRKEAREDFKFFSGDQWSADDKAALAAKNRVPVVFNRIAPIVNAVVGSEINNRREVQYIPRELGDAQANEVLTAAGEWFRDQTGAEDEESDAFEDTVVCGMGWTDTRLDFEEDPDGAPKIERIDPMEMVWDCNASKSNLQDAERLFRVKEFSWAEARELFPNVERGLLNASWARSGVEGVSPHDQDRADLYEDDDNQGSASYQRNCLIVEARWFQREPFYRGPDLETQEIREYTEEQVSLLRKKYPGFPAVKQTRKIVRRAFIGKDILEDPDKPQVPPGMFGWECMTGYKDKAESHFYGVVRSAKDPQRWTNKFFSQVMFLLNSQSKGGIAAERGAFENDREAEASWAKSDEITWMAKNGIEKIKDKAPAQFPAGFFTLFQESKDEITQVTGLSPEFIGTREVTQAGVLEMQRRQSSLNLLASLFNSLRRYRKRQGKTMLYLIQNFLSDGRLVRIVGDDKKQYVPLTKENVASSTYDIIVDDAPTSPNEKERTWGILMQLLPLVKDLMSPDMLLEALKTSPLPASMVDKMQKKMVEQQQQQSQQPSPEQMAMEAKAQELQMNMQAKQADAQLKLQGQQADLQIAQAKGELDVKAKAIDAFYKQQEAQMKLEASAEALNQRIAAAEVQSAIARQNAAARQTSAAK